MANTNPIPASMKDKGDAVIFVACVASYLSSMPQPVFFFFTGCPTLKDRQPGHFNWRINHMHFMK